MQCLIDFPSLSVFSLYCLLLVYSIFFLFSLFHTLFFSLSIPFCISFILHLFSHPIIYLISPPFPSTHSAPHLFSFVPLSCTTLLSASLTISPYFLCAVWLTHFRFCIASLTFLSKMKERISVVI